MKSEEIQAVISARRKTANLDGIIEEIRAMTAEDHRAVCTREWRITSLAGVYLGTYRATSESEALDAMARDACYQDYNAVVAAVGGEVSVEEV